MATVLVALFVTVKTVGADVCPTVTFPKLPLPGVEVSAQPAAKTLATVRKSDTIRIRFSRIHLPK
jgi:hypothetical protein